MPFQIPSDDWNAAVDRLERKILIPGKNCALNPSPNGVSVNYTGVSSFEHPWTVQPFWDIKKEVWRTYVAPGFVNGVEPAIRMPVGKDGDVPPDSEVIGNDYGDKDIPESGDVEVGLLDSLNGLRPFIRVDKFWPAQGPEAGGAQGKYPDFFRYLGARAADPVDILNFGDISDDTAIGILQGTIDPTTTVGLQQQYGDRSLFSSDIVLRVEKGIFVEEVSTSSDIIFGGIERSYVYQPPISGKHGCYVYCTDRWYPPPLPDAADRIAGDYSDYPFDEIVLARVWFMSTGPANLFKPDGSWQPFVEHRVFWNIHYATINQKDATKSNRLSLVTGLAGGIADLLIAGFLTSINDAFDAAAAGLNRTSNDGSFWTA